MNTSDKRVKFCPSCGFPWTMEPVFHLKHPIQCCEDSRWRFQRCGHCGWSGDVVSKKQFVFRRWKGMLLVDGLHYPGGLHGFLKSIGLC